MTSPANSAVLGSRSPRSPRSAQKSAVTNGTRLLPGIDGRGQWIRRCKDIIADLTSDRGGVSELSAAEASLIRRAATMSVELEALEARFAEAGQASAADLDLYGRTTGNLRRVLETLGIHRRARTVGAKSLADILAELDAEKAAAAVTIENEAAE
jgi:hypothetical protein